MSATASLVMQAVAFLAVILAIEGVYLFIRSNDRRERAVNRRMQLAAARNERVVNPELFRRQIEGGLLSRMFTRIIPGFNNLVWRAAAGVTPSQIAMIMTGIALGLAFLFVIILKTAPLVGFGGAFLAGVGGPYLFLSMKAGARQRKFNEQLPTAIDMMVRGLQAGHPAPVAMEIVAREMQDPIGSEFGVALDEMNYGLERSVALRNISARFPSPEFKFLISTMEMQKETGGNLAEVLGNLSRVIRERATMKKKVWAISAEGRLSCFVVGGLPFVLTLAIMGLNPAFFTDVADDPMFAPMIGGAFVLWAIGVSWIWRMVNFKF